jgi:hypothetical protein
MKSRQKRFRATLAAQFDACKESKFETDNQTLEKLINCWFAKEAEPFSKEDEKQFKKQIGAK